MSRGFRLYTGPGVRQKAQSLVEECQKRFLRGKGDSFALVVPTHRYAVELSRRLYLSSPGDWHQARVFPIEQFMERFLPPGFREHRIVHREETVILVRQLVLDAPGPCSPLFSEGGGPFTNMLASIADLFGEIRMEGTSTSQLREICEKRNDLCFLPDLFERYAESLENHNLLDRSDVVRLAASHCSRDAIDLVFPDLDLLIFDGMDFFPSLFIDFLKIISSHVPVTVVLVEYERDRPSLFSHMEEPVRRLCSCAGSVHDLEDDSNPSSRKSLLERLYGPLDPKAALLDMGDFLQIYALPDRLREVIFIARTIKRLVCDSDDLLPRDICVCFPRLDQYASLIREVFPDYGIPFNLSLGVPLSRVPLVRAIEIFLNLVEGGFERSRLLSFLRCSYFCLEKLINREKPPSRDEILRALLPLRVGSGIENWIEAVQTQLHIAVERLKGLEEGRIPPEREDSPDDPGDSLRETIGIHESILQLLEAIKEMTDPLGNPNTCQGHAANFRSCLDALGLERGLLIPPGEEAEGNLFRRDVTAWERFREILESMEVLPFSPSGDSKSFPHFSRELRFRIQTTEVYTEEVIHDAVQLLGRLEPRMFSFRYFILAGFLDGDFPHPPHPTIFLSRVDREKIGLMSSREDLAADRFLFHHFLRQTRDCLIITRPSHEGENPLLASPLLREIRRHADVGERVPDPETHMFCESEIQSAMGSAASGSDARKNMNLITRLYEGMKATKGKPGECVRATGIQRESGARLDPDHPILSNPRYSITQLEEYGRCPFHYYVRRVLGLKESEEPEEAVTPMERGNLVHHSLYRFYTARAGRGNVAFTSGEDAEKASVELVTIAREEADSLPYQDLFWEMERERLLGGSGPEERPGLLPLFIQQEREYFSNPEGAYVPGYFETAFGSVPGPVPERDPLSSEEWFSIEHPGGPILLRGRIDRIEIKGDLFSVVDYKTGSHLPNIHELEDGLSLQLAIYLSVARERLERQLGREMQPAGGIYYQINSEKKLKRDSQLILKSQRKSLLGSNRKRTFCESPGELEALLELAKRHVRTHVTGIRGGQFPLSTLPPRRAMCGHCEFRLSCRREIARMFRPGR